MVQIALLGILEARASRGLGVAFVACFLLLVPQCPRGTLLWAGDLQGVVGLDLLVCEGAGDGTLRKVQLLYLSHACMAWGVPLSHSQEGVGTAAGGDYVMVM